MTKQDYLSICINDSNPNAFCVIHVELDENNNPIDWTFEYCNDALAKLENKPKEELIGHKFYSIFPNGDRKWLKPYYEAAYLNKPSKFEEISEELGVYLHIAVFPTGIEGYCACVLRDIKDTVLERNEQAEKLAETVKKLEAEKELNKQVRDYASAMGVVYPLTIHFDYTNNFYQIMEYENCINKKAPRMGNIDDFIEIGVSTIPDKDEAEIFRNKFNTQSVLEAFKRGEKEVNLRHRQYDDEGNIHWMNTRIICIHYSSDHIQALGLSRCVDEETKQQQLILEKEQASTAAKIAENDYKMLHKLIKSGMWRMYYDSDYHLTKVEWSDDYRKMIGYESEEDFPNTLEAWENLVHPDDLSKVLMKMEPFLKDTEGKLDYEIEYRIKTRNRGYRWFRETGIVSRREDGSPYCFFGVFFDVTDAKEREKLEKQKNDALQRANDISKEIDSLHKALGSAAWTFKYNHQNELVSVRWSQSLREILGYKSEAEFPNILESGIRRIHPDDQDKVKEEYDKTLQDITGKHIFDVEFRACIHQGEFRWFKSIGRIERRKDLSADTFYGLSMDIDERKKIDESLKKALVEAEAASKSKSKFLRNMSHDIRTPINGIMGLLEMSDQYPNDVVKLQENRLKMKRTTNYLLSLVNNILDTTKFEDGHFTLENKPFNLKTLLSDEVETLKSQINGLNISFDTKGNKSKIDHPNLIGSVQHLNCILMNIAWNAIKYNRPNGTIDMYTREISYDGTTAVFEFTCEDTGIGMSEEFQKHMYEPFTQEGKTSITTFIGSGLGLPLVKEALDLLNGTIECTSKENVGTKFVVTIPFLVDQEKKDSTEIKELDLTNKKALVVDDNELNREIATALLEQEGMIVDTVDDGKKAIERFSESKINEYDVIFMDIMMPVLDGIEATKEIRSLEREDARTIPIVAMTANSFNEDKVRCNEAGMDDHIAKPIDINKIRTVLQKILVHID